MMADAGKSDWGQRHFAIQRKRGRYGARGVFMSSRFPRRSKCCLMPNEKGYETSCNIMAISTVQDVEIDQALEVLMQTPVGTICVVDSFGALYREQVDMLVRKYMEAAKGTGKEVGIHAHNNQQLAFANTIEAIILGANRVDGTVDGLGRGCRQLPHGIVARFFCAIPSLRSVRSISCWRSILSSCAEK